MCGRYSLIATEKEIKEQLTFIEERGVKIQDSYNIAPTQTSAVVTNEEPYRLQNLSWGLIPSWSKDGKNQGRLINARSEGILGKPSFRVPVRRKRCVVIADGFYEWKRVGKEKIPYRILPKDDTLLFMAGIWEEWGSGEDAKRTFSVITTTPNEEIQPLHNRAPVVFTDEAECLFWLENNKLEEIAEMLKPTRNSYFKIYRVSQMVNSVRNNSPHLHEEVPEEADLFSQN